MIRRTNSVRGGGGSSSSTRRAHLRAVAGVVCACAVTLSGAAPARARCTPADAQRLAQQGDKLLRGKDSRRARTHYERALARCADDPALRCGYARAQASERVCGQALGALAACLRQTDLPLPARADARRSHELTLLRCAVEQPLGAAQEVGSVPGAHAMAPRWAPGRKRVSFEARPLKQARQLFVVDLATNKRTQPVPDFFDTGTEAERREAARRIGLIPRFHVAWHPGGLNYLYLSGLPNEHPINVFMHEEGCLTCAEGFSAARKFHPAWSSDGEIFAYTTLEKQQARIRAVTLLKLAEGPRTLVDGAAVGGVPYRPVFGPKPGALAFQVHRTDVGETDLFVVDDLSDTKRPPRRLTSMAGSEFDATWSPDGAWIAFWASQGLYPGRLSDDQADRHGVGDIDLYVVPADGSEPPSLLAANVVWGHSAGPAWTSGGGLRVWFVKRSEALADPLMWVARDGSAAGRMVGATEHNADLAITTHGGSAHLAWAASPKRAGAGARWRRVFRASVELPEGDGTEEEPAPPDAPGEDAADEEGTP